MKKWYCVLAVMLLLSGCDMQEANEQTATDKSVELIQFNEVQSGDLLATLHTSMGDMKLPPRQLKIL